MTKLPDLPKYEEFFKPTLEALSMLGGSASVEELEEAIVAALGLTQEQLDLKHEKSGSPVLAYRMSWARSWLKIPRLVDNPERGVWMLTEKGRMASAFPSDELKRMVSVAYTASKLAKVAHDGGRADNSTTADIDAQ